MKKRIFSLLLALCLLMALMPVYASAQAEEAQTDEAQLFAYNGVSVEPPADTSKVWVSEENAVIAADVVKPNGAVLSNLGIYIYTNDGALMIRFIEDATEKIDPAWTRFNMWYNLGDVLSLIPWTPTHGTTYRYQFFVVYNGTEVKGNTYSVQLAGEPFEMPAMPLEFKGNGGSIPMSEQGKDGLWVVEKFNSATKDVKDFFSIGYMPTPVREGYTFLGWYTAAQGGTRVSSSTIVYGQNNRTLYAHWQQNEKPKETFTVTFDPMGGTVSPTSKQVVEDDPIGTMPVPVREGYVFKGWITDEGWEVKPTTTVGGSATLYAQWEKAETETLTLYFDANGGTVSPTSMDVKKGTAIGAMPVPTRSGYVFKGWFNSKTGGEIFTENSILDAGGWLFAQWEKSGSNKCTITLDANGGTVSPATMTIASGRIIGDRLPTPTRSGYVFFGWAVERDGEATVNTDTVVVGDFTLYAKWVRKTGVKISVNFDANGGYVAEKSRAFDEYEYLRNLPIPTRSGYTFDGWYSEKTGGVRIKDIHYLTVGVNGESYNLYAHWTRGGTSEMKFTDVPYSIYYYNPVKWAVGKNITTGTTESTFEPDKICSKVQIITFLWRAAGRPQSSVSSLPYTDIDRNDYYYDALRWAYSLGMIDNSSRLNPHSNCSRAMMVEYMWKAEGSPSASATTSFKDVSSGSSYAKAVSWAVEEGLTKGTSDTTFSPDNTCTRGQIVTILYRQNA